MSKLARIFQFGRDVFHHYSPRVRGLFQEAKDYLKPGTRAYRRHARLELEHYSKAFRRDDSRSRETLFEPAPAAWIEIDRRATELIRQATGNDVAGHVLARLQSRPHVRLLSLGSGPGGVELMLAREAPAAEYLCLDFNPELLRLGQERAQAEGLPVRFEQADLNTAALPKRAFDLVLCHACLHHIVELERLAEQIKDALRPGGELVVVDLMTPNGGRMWPETRRVARAIFATLPARYRLNHTACRSPRVDDKIWEASATWTGLEGVRSADVLPVLKANFATKLFFPYLTLSRRFFDTMYGWNYDLEQPLDRAILDWIWALDRHYLASGQLRAETFFGIFTPADR